MAFVTGMLLIDAPAAALNNAGADEVARTDNAVATKSIRTARGALPYVSAQAYRYWLRTTIQREADGQWMAAPVYREQKVAYTDANPIVWADDDLFGYMRAPSKRADAAERRRNDPSRANETPTTTEITRVSPFRVSTFVGLRPRPVIDDFGTMSRHEGDPVPHQHQFYRTVLKGLFSLDLHAAGTFSYRNRTGYRNLDDTRYELAQERQLTHLPDEQSFRLPTADRAARVGMLLRGMALLNGGAKQALHYTDVTPVIVIAMVTRGGNNPLQYLIDGDADASPVIKTAVLAELARVWSDQIMSPLYVGWVEGFHDEQRTQLVAALEEIGRKPVGERLPLGHRLAHPREMFEQLARDLAANADTWMA